MSSRFKCVRCGTKWSSASGPTQCPCCGHLYVKVLA